jgi:hypothetical protein
MCISLVENNYINRYSIKSIIFWNVTPCSLIKSTNILEECTTSIFRVTGGAEQETSKNRQQPELDYMTSHPTR